MEYQFSSSCYTDSAGRTTILAMEKKTVAFIVPGFAPAPLVWGAPVYAEVGKVASSVVSVFPIDKLKTLVEAPYWLFKLLFSIASIFSTIVRWFSETPKRLRFILDLPV